MVSARPGSTLLQLRLLVVRAWAWAWAGLVGVGAGRARVRRNPCRMREGLCKARCKLGGEPERRSICDTGWRWIRILLGLPDSK